MKVVSKFLLLALIAILPFATFAYPSKGMNYIVVPSKRKPEDASHQYYTKLLALIINVTELEYGPAKIQFFPYPSHGRTMRMLASGDKLDLAWGGIQNGVECIH